MSDELPKFKKVVLPGDEQAADSAPVTSDGPVDPVVESAPPEVPAPEVNSGGLPVSADGGDAPPPNIPDDPNDDPSAYPDSGDGDGGDEGEDGEDGEENQGRMGVLGHLNEFRRCLTRISLSVLVGFLCAYPFATQLFVLLMKPMNDAMNVVASNKVVLTPEFFAALKDTLVSAMADKGPEFAEQTTYFVTALQLALEKVVVNQGQFIYTYPPEAFFAEVKVAVVAGIFLVSPYVFFQIWRFVAPGLYSHERRWVWPIAMISALFFVTGSSFGYFVVFPVGFEFFAQFTSDSISFMPKLSEYLSFALKLLIAFGVAFELPVFIFFLARLGIVTGRGLMKKSKYFILIAFIVGAVLTPPDPVSQALMAGPLILLYAIGVVIAFLFGKRKPKPAVEEPEEESPPAK